MNLQLDHALALVTASTGGIGKEIATTLAREGVTVIINGRTPSSVEAAIADIRASVPCAKLEKLAADNGTAAGAAETVRQFPEVDVLINNLGIYEAVKYELCGVEDRLESTVSTFLYPQMADNFAFRSDNEIVM
jgi:3-oxoacyl-[acyl-carrier protein] reductase